MSRVTIFREFSFEAAHRLPFVPTGHKCSNVHGHSYRVEIYVAGEIDPDMGWVMDFAVLTEACQPLRDLLDHTYLNRIEGLSNPTSEVLARWIWTRLAPMLSGLSRVVVRETCASGVIYEGA